VRKRNEILSVGVVSTVFPTAANPVAGIFVKEELDHLSDLADIRLLAPLPNQHWWKEVRSRKEGPGTPYPVVRPFTLAFPRWFMQRLYPSSLAVTLRKFGGALFDGCHIVHAHNAFPEGCAAVKAFARDVPVIVTVHGSDVNHFAMKPNLRPGIVGALNACSRIISVSAALASTLKRIGVTTETVVIPNGVDTATLGPGEKGAAAESLGLDPARPRLLFAGNFVPVKGIDCLIDAMPAVLDRFPGCELVLLGASPGIKDRGKYRERIAGAGVERAVIIRDRVPRERFPAWVHACDLLVLPSIREGFGLVAAEALACGRPVVSTFSGGPEDIVLEGMGELVEPKNPDALAGAIVRVLHGSDIMDAGKLAASAVERFSYGNVAKRIYEVYESVVFQGGVPGCHR